MPKIGPQTVLIGCLNGFSILPSRRFLTIFFIYLVKTMFKKTTCQILLHTDVSWKRYGLLKLRWYYTTYGSIWQKKVVHSAHLITPDSAEQLVLRTEQLMSAHLVEYAASARDLSLFHCDVVVHSCACSALHWPLTWHSPWRICLHARCIQPVLYMYACRANLGSVQWHAYV